MLARMLSRYWQGLTMPLKFFPKSSLAYLHKGSFEAAHKVWKHGDHPESGDPYYRLVFGGSDPLDAEFAEIAADILGGYLMAMEGKP
jgi:exodeoxyribonuclease V gamma subunit